MFAVLALWLGALALMTVFSPVPLHARGSTRGALRLTLETFAVPAAVGLVTGLAAGAVLAGLEDLDAGGWVATMGFGALVSVAFVAVNQALAAALGHVGRGISLLIAVLVIATGVVSTVPAVLEGLAAFLPVGPAIVGLGRLVEPGTGSVGMAIASMILWGIAGRGRDRRSWWRGSARSGSRSFSGPPDPATTPRNLATELGRDRTAAPVVLSRPVLRRQGSACARRRARRRRSAVSGHATCTRFVGASALDRNASRSTIPSGESSMTVSSGPSPSSTQYSASSRRPRSSTSSSAA